MEIERLDIEMEIGIGEVISEQDRKRGLLIPILHKVQEEYGYLPGEVLEGLSARLALPLAEIYSVASFYSQFHFTPRGKNIVRVCVGTACHVRGASKVLDTLEKHFKVGAGETTGDLTMTLETVGCVGCCGLAPVLTVNEDIIGETGPGKLKKLIERIEEE